MRMHASWKEGAGRKVLAALLSASLVMQGLPTATLAEAADVDVAVEATDEALDTMEATPSLDAQALAERVRGAVAEGASQAELARALVEACAGEELPTDKEAAQAFAEAARALGLESEAVEGADGSAWNLVCVDGAWYHVDVVNYVAEREALGEEEAAVQWLFVSDEAMASHEGRGSWALAGDSEAEVPAAPANLTDALMLAADEAAAEQAEPEGDERADPEVANEAAEPKAAEEQVEPEAAEEQVEPEVTEEATEPEVAEELPESEDVAVHDESEEAPAEVEEVTDVDRAEPAATEPVDVEPAPELIEDTAFEEPLFAEGNVPIKVRFNAYYNRAHEMLSLVNSSRSAAGVGGVGWDYSLEQFALQRAGELVLRYAHFRPDGSTGYANEAIASYKPGCWGQENIQYASWAMSASEMNSRWDASSGHHATRVRGDYTCYAAAIIEVDGIYWMVEALSTGSPSYSYFATGNNVFGSVWVQLNSAYTSMHMSPDEVTANEGQTTTSTPYVCNSYQSSDVFSWKVANPSIASVTTADGPLKIKGLSEGTTTITGTAAAGSVSLKVTVKSTKVNVTSVTMSKSSLALTVGDTSTLSATVYPSNATDKRVTWSSSNSSVASIDSSGKVTAKSAGTATIYATASNGKKASCSVTVTAIDLSNGSIDAIREQEYTGYAVEPIPGVSLNGVVLAKDVDYVLSYKNNISAGTATVTVTGKGKYRGSMSRTFTIYPTKTVVVRVAWNDFDDMFGMRPDSVDFTYSYEGKDSSSTKFGGMGVGNYATKSNGWTTTTSRFRSASYDGSPVSFKINPKEVSGYTVSATGSVDTGYTITYTSTKLPSVSDASVTGVSDKTYTGSALTQNPTVIYNGTTLRNGTDYTISYTNNVNAGTATMTITGKGTYSGTRTASFTIKPKSLPSNAVTLSAASYTYDGKVKSPTVTVKDGSKTLTVNTDYTLTTPSGRTNAGTYTYTVTGKGGYTGTATAKLTIKPASIASAVVDMPTYVLPTDGEPASTLTLGGKTLKKGTDYLVTYDGVPYADFWGYFGSHTATFTGKGNYAGTVSADFVIQMADLGTITYRIGEIPDQAYTGSAITPRVSVYRCHAEGEETLVQGTDYTVSYRNNVQLGTATAIVTGTGRYTGTREIAFTIVGTDGRFPDVRQGSWYYNVVNRAAALGLVSGYVNGNFGPNDNVTRGQVAVMLWNMAGRPGAYGWKEFPDVVAGKYYSDAVKWAAAAGVVNGYADGTYGPDDLVTREQLATMLANYAKKIGWLAVEGSADDYAGMYDAGNVSGYARQAVGWCFRNGIISGKADGALDPQGHATRAETAKMLVVLYDMLA